MSDRVPHPGHPDRWADGTVRPGNQTARTHGVRAFEARGDGTLPADLRVSVDEFRAQIIADRGGIDNLTAIEAGYIAKLTDVDVMSRLLMADLRERGVFTPKGRVRNTFTKLLDVFAAWDRFAQRVGPDRRPKRVPSLAEVMNSDE
jgi:hypothetical protein